MLREHLSKTHSGLHVKGTCGGDSDDVIIAGALEDRVVNAGVLLRTSNAVPNKRADARRRRSVHTCGQHARRSRTHACAAEPRQRHSVATTRAAAWAPPPQASRHRAIAPSRHRAIEPSRHRAADGRTLLCSEAARRHSAPARCAAGHPRARTVAPGAAQTQETL
jgi:hypothetical protein